MKYWRLSDVPPKYKYVFSIDRGYKRFFVGFESYQDFLVWYFGIPARLKTANEVAREDARKLWIDIDNPEDDETWRKLIMYDFERHITSKIANVFFKLDIGKPDVAIYSMCNDYQISYHVVVTNFSFSARTCACLCRIIAAGEPWAHCTDFGVYKSVQCIRVEGSTKYGEERWKQLIGHPRSIRDGLISDLDGTKLSELKMRDTSPTTMYYPRQGIMHLRRRKPGFCIQCNRVHDRENAFIYTDITGQRAFMCWRYYYRAS
jgi:hypothetical protein